MIGLLLALSLAGMPRYHAHTIAVASGTCPVGTPGLAPDGVEWGISLSGLRAWKATICPESGRTFTGSGAVRACVYSALPWGPGQWAPSSITFDLTGRSSTLAHPCLEMVHLEVGVALSDRVFLLPESVGVSGGTTLTVYLAGELR